MIEQFLLDPEVTFLNHGTFGACPRDVFSVYQGWQLELERNPVEFLGRRSAELLLHARTMLAARMGTSAANLVFVGNTTMGVNAIAKSLHLCQGDEILATDHEYGACNNTWEQVCRQRGACYITATIPLPFQRDQFVEHVWKRVTPRTRVIFVSHLTSTTALIFPLEELCRRAAAAGILTVVDGAHAPGQLDLHLDTLGADFYLGNCHKWLMAPKGSAFLYARPHIQELVHGLVTSWGYSKSVQGYAGFDAYTGVTVLERRHQWQGTRDIAAFLAVPAALQFRYNASLTRKFEECRELTRGVHDRILERNRLSPIATPHDFYQMAAIPILTENPRELQETLFNRYRIEVPLTSHGGQHFIRVSLQVYNNENDIDRLISALEKLSCA